MQEASRREAAGSEVHQPANDGSPAFQPKGWGYTVITLLSAAASSSSSSSSSAWRG
ncbi:hypothetical protein ASPCADRAFT_208370 [Aspergillus carbonarius ITEM 5010]|uniref:Uncharacterized protein n=1 Tax=Aspergillus carbonarius (strain ITEM 5010) TaxID=602072 RepID=A0A1R3RJR7_ASPC5|nr:hypothetical protein ASPCADRAFT_208370 [Aspergillus carbonarius ITEM 5010]